VCKKSVEYAAGLTTYGGSWRYSITLRLYNDGSCRKCHSWKRRLSSTPAHRTRPLVPGMLLLHVFTNHQEKPVAEYSMSQTSYAVNKFDETTPPSVTKNVLQLDFRFSTFPLYKKNVPVRGGRRATIKAHPATPHHPRPYGKGISPGRMESVTILLLSDVGNNAIIARCFHPRYLTRLPGASGIS
jgi:hypothetical protein